MTDNELRPLYTYKYVYAQLSVQVDLYPISKLSICTPVFEY